MLEIKAFDEIKVEKNQMLEIKNQIQSKVKVDLDNQQRDISCISK